MHKLRLLLLSELLLRAASPAGIAISTYLKSGFTPSAMAADSQGDIYLAGSAVIDPVSGATSALVIKVDPKVTQYLYLTYLDSAANDQVSAIAVDSAGNAFVTGFTANPNFPVVGGSGLGTPPTSVRDARSFVTKLDSQGAVVFSVLIGGSAMSSAQGIAITPKGQILVSGIASSSGFPTTTGAYTVSDSTGQWFLMELDASASQTIFSATGIGGSSLALDPAGNVYMAGSSAGTGYPTTAGAYQATLVQGYYCYGQCQISYPGGLQHITKVDPAATTLIYSTGLNNTGGLAGNTTNTGLAVDAMGNAYVTGTLFQSQYLFTVTPPASYTSYLSKLDPAGAKLLFSIPVGGAGVQSDSAGAVYVGGVVASDRNTAFFPDIAPVAPPSPFSWVPQLCWPDNITGIGSAYVMKVNAGSGNVMDAQWIDGSGAGATALTMSGGYAWITGTSVSDDVPYSPGVFAPENIAPGFLAGAYLSAVDFSTGPNTGPAIACVLDSGNMTHVGPVASYQLISLFGANLGPAAGEGAPDGTSTSLGGVSVSFDGVPAQLLYVSSSQINVVVPEPPASSGYYPLPTSTVMKLTVGTNTVERQFPFTASNPNLFANLSSDAPDCAGTNNTGGFQPLAQNADGSLNSCINPAAFGSTVSLFVHGAGAESLGFPPAPGLSNLQAVVGSCPAFVTGASLIDGYVYKVDVTMPSQTCAQPYTVANFPVALSYNGAAVGPREIPGSNTAMVMFVWLK